MMACEFEKSEDRLRALEAEVLGVRDRLARVEDSDKRQWERFRQEAERKPPPRETAWVVETSRNAAVWREDGKIGTAIINGAWRRAILRFPSRSDAETLARLLGVGTPTLIFTDTMEEVPGDADV